MMEQWPHMHMQHHEDITIENYPEEEVKGYVRVNSTSVRAANTATHFGHLRCIQEGLAHIRATAAWNWKRLITLDSPGSDLRRTSGGCLVEPEDAVYLQGRSPEECVEALRSRLDVETPEVRAAIIEIIND